MPTRKCITPQISNEISFSSGLPCWTAAALALLCIRYNSDDWRIAPSVIYMKNSWNFNRLASWIIGLVKYILDPVLKLYDIWKGLCVLPSGLSGPRKISYFFALNSTNVRFIYSENYKCDTKALSCKHLTAIMVSSDLTLFDFIPSFWTPMLYLYVPTYVIIISLSAVWKYSVCTFN